MSTSLPDHAGCQVVCGGYAASTDRWNVVCPALPAKVKDEIEATTGPRVDPPDTHRRLQSIARRHGLRGIALIWNATPFPRSTQYAMSNEDVYYLDPPPPMLAPFEPAELSEESRTVRAIAALEDLGGSVPTSTSPRLARTGWSSLNLFAAGLLAFALMLLSCCWWSAFAGDGPWVATMCLVVPASAVALVALTKSSAAFGRWFIVPGGVIVRNAGRWFSGVRLELYIPADTLLRLAPQPPGWEAVLYRGDQRRVRVLTRRECTALLRAWQSPLQAPPLHQLDDLR